eukprot:8037926-Alexandrium_andersonii.AAC.1
MSGCVFVFCAHPYLPFNVFAGLSATVLFWLLLRFRVVFPWVCAVSAWLLLWLSSLRLEVALPVWLWVSG